MLNDQASTSSTIHLIRLTEFIGSDFEARRGLSTIAENRQMQEQSWQEIFAAVDNIGSDFEAGRLISTLALLETNSTVVANLALEATASIGSDHEMQSTIRTIIESCELDISAWQLVLRRVENDISSNHEVGNLLEVIANKMPDNESLKQQFNFAVMGLSSKRQRERLFLL